VLLLRHKPVYRAANARTPTMTAMASMTENDRNECHYTWHQANQQGCDKLSTGSSKWCTSSRLGKIKPRQISAICTGMTADTTNSRRLPVHAQPTGTCRTQAQPVAGTLLRAPQCIIHAIPTAHAQQHVTCSARSAHAHDAATPLPLSTSSLGTGQACLSPSSQPTASAPSSAAGPPSVQAH
jgi:hypothetical protein